jgi:hypothetical protein
MIMTIGNPDNDYIARRFSAEVLGVPENASPLEIRRAYFRKLREGDFLPPNSLRHSFRFLDGKQTPDMGDQEWLLEEEVRLRTELASFAAEYFSLPLNQRRARWEALFSRCQHFAALLARLQALKAGLDIDNQGLLLDQSFRGQLAEHLLKAFPLPPLAQVASGQGLLCEIEESSAAKSQKQWEKAARYLLREEPALAALDMELVQQIANLRSRLRRRRKMHRLSQWYRGPAATKNDWRVLLLLPAILIIIWAASRNMSWQTISRPRSEPNLDTLRGRIIADANFTLTPKNLPPLDDLLDPFKFDVGMLEPVREGILYFTPRRDSTTKSGPAQSNDGKPIWVAEATLRLKGATPQQITALHLRAQEKKRLDDTSKARIEETHRTSPK